MKTFSIVITTDGSDIIDRVPADDGFFKTLTTFSETSKNAVIMGLNTFNALGVLSDRIVIVVTATSLHVNHRFLHVTSRLNNALQIAGEIGCDRVFVVGGRQLFQTALQSSYLECIYQLSATGVSSNKLLTPVPPGASEIRLPTHVKYLLPLHEEFQYLHLLRRVLTDGSTRKTRNGVVRSLFGEQLTFDLQHFPLYTTKKMFLRGVFEELKFFLLGCTNSKILEEKGVNIWQANTSRHFLDSMGFPDRKEGDMGPMYFFNVLHYGADYVDCDTDYSGQGYNQFEYVLHQLRTDPHSRRILFTTFNPLNAQRGVLYPCHGLITQFYVEADKLSCSVTIRSNDLICGNPFNVASYALLVYIMCQLLDNIYQPGKLIMFINDAHIYEQHLEVAHQLLTREPYPFPTLSFRKPIHTVADMEWSDVILSNYRCHPPMKVNMVP